MYYITHGSENSIDQDIYVVVDSPLSDSEAKKLCYEFSPMNANILCIKNHQVTWAYKGTIDECNNSIIFTFCLHKQTVQCPVNIPMKRSCGLKLLRTLRGLLSYCSRTKYRKDVKRALKSTNIMEKLDVLSQIDITEIDDYGKNSLVEVYKFFAFQLGQTLALLERRIELFTKNSVSNFYEDLRPYIMREEGCRPEILKEYWDRFYWICINSVSVSDDKTLVEIHFTEKEVLDTKKEIIIN